MNKPTFSLLMVFLCAASFVQAKKQDERPNILWITTEDISPHLGCYGDEYAHTPTLDNMAKEGVLYTNAYASAPVCTPARSSIITGMFASSLGSQHLRGQISLGDDVKCFTEYLWNSGYHCMNFNKTDYNFAVPEKAWDFSIDWMERIPHDSLVNKYLVNVPENKPFFCVFNFFLTHQSRTRYGMEELKEKNSRLPVEARHDPDNAPVPPYYPNTPEVRANLAMLHTQVTLLDRNVKEILDDLEKYGFADNTIVFFYSDHGDGLPRHKRWNYDSGLKVPFIIRYPKKYQHLSPANAGGQVTSLINFVDLAPTMLSVTGCDVPQNMQGKIFLGPEREERNYTFAIRDRIDEVYEFVRNVSDDRYQYIRNFSNDKPRMQWSNYSEITPIRKEIRRLAEPGQLNAKTGWLMQETKPVEELYDLQNDPHQMTNLAGDPQYSDIQKRLKEALFDWMIETRDLSLIPEPLMRREAEKQSPRETWSTNKNFPVEKVLHYADMKGRGEAYYEELKRGLADKSPIVRYWSAKGMAELGEKAEDAGEELKKLLSDEYPVVRIAAADALCKAGDYPEAVQTLGDLLLHRDIVTRVYAAVALGEFPEKASQVQDKINRSLESEAEHILDGNYRTYFKNAVKRINP